MHNAHNLVPLSPAAGAGTATRVGASLPDGWLPRMARRAASLPIFRGVTR